MKLCMVDNKPQGDYWQSRVKNDGSKRPYEQAEKVNQHIWNRNQGTKGESGKGILESGEGV